MFTRNLAALLVSGLALIGACSDGSTSSSNGSSGDPGTVDAGTSSGQVSSSSDEASTSSGTGASSSSGQVSSSMGGSSSGTSGDPSSSSNSGSATSGNTSTSSGGTSGSSGTAMGTLEIYTEGPAGGDMYVNGALYALVSGNGDQPVPAGTTMNVEMRCGSSADRKLPLYQDNVMVQEGQRVAFLGRDSGNPARYPKNICGGWQDPEGTTFQLTAVKTEDQYEKQHGLWKFLGNPQSVLVVDGTHLTGLGEQGAVHYTGEIASNGGSFTLTFIPDSITWEYTWISDLPCQ